MRTFGASDTDIDFSIVDELESVMQRVKQRLRWWRGTWFLAIQRGVPYVPDTLGHLADPDLARASITNEILSVPDVTDVRDILVRFEPGTRGLFYSATVITPYGTSDLFGRVGGDVVVQTDILGPSSVIVTRPNPPLRLTAHPVGRNDIELVWEPPRDNGGSALTGFRLQVSDDALTWAELDLLPPTVYSFDHSGLAPGTLKFYRAFAINAIGNSFPSNIASARTRSVGNAFDGGFDGGYE